MKRRDERVGRAATSARRRAELQQPAVDDHADPVRERRGVLEVVRDEHRRQPEAREQLAELGADRVARVRVERRERLVEQQHVAGRARARARARPAGARRRRARRARASRDRDAEALEQLVDVVLPGAPNATLRATVEVREERVLLEDEPDRRRSGGHVDPARRVEPASRPERDPARGPGARSPATPAAPSSCPRRTARRARPSPRATLERQLRARTSGEEGEIEVERRHEGTSLTARRTTALTTTSSAPIASATSKSTSNCS